MLTTIKNNPLYTIGVTADFSKIARTEKITRLKSFAKLKRPVASWLELRSLLGKPKNKLSAIEEAATALQDPVAFTQFSLFWFYAFTDNQKQALKAVIANDFPTAKKLITDDFENFGSYLNLALVSFLEEDYERGLIAILRVLFEPTLKQKFLSHLALSFGEAIDISDETLAKIVIDNMKEVLSDEQLQKIFASCYSWPMNIFNEAGYQLMTKDLVLEKASTIDTLINKNSYSIHLTVAKKIKLLTNASQVGDKFDKELTKLAKQFDSNSDEYKAVTNKIANYFMDLAIDCLQDRELNQEPSNITLASTVFYLAEPYLRTAKVLDKFKKLCSTNNIVVVQEQLLSDDEEIPPLIDPESEYVASCLEKILFNQAKTIENAEQFLSEITQHIPDLPKRIVTLINKTVADIAAYHQQLDEAPNQDITQLFAQILKQLNTLKEKFTTNPQLKDVITALHQELFKKHVPVIDDQRMSGIMLNLFFISFKKMPVNTEEFITMQNDLIISHAYNMIQKDPYQKLMYQELKESMPSRAIKVPRF